MSLDELRKLDPETIHSMLQQEVAGQRSGELPIEVALRQAKCLDSPAYFATEVYDPWYARNFEPIHYQMLDEVLGPYIAGETVRIEGVNHEPHWYTGLLILFSRGTLKSSCAKIITLWEALYSKYRLNRDARTAYVHQVLDKAILQTEGMRETARKNKLFRETFPEFRSPPGREWDTKQMWRWPNFGTYQANEFSMTSYGESSNKIGGHYTLRMVDDWVTPESVTNATMLSQSERDFRAMDNLRDRTVRWNPWIAMGTHYHYQDTYMRLREGQGWLTWIVPGHKGSGKTIFDLAEISTRTEEGRRKVERGLKKLETERADDLNFPKILDWRELYRSLVAQRAEGEGLGGSHHEYNTQILLQPVPKDEARFSHEQLDACWADHYPGPSEAQVVVRVDPAISEGRTSDEFVINVALVDWQGDRWYVDGWLGRLTNPSEMVRKIFKITKRWIARGYKAQSIGIESVAFQEALAGICRNGVPDREPEFDGELIPVQKAPCTVVSIKRAGNTTKHQRILGLDGPLGRGTVHVYKNNPVGERIINDSKQFPYGPDHLLDTMHDMYVMVSGVPKPLLPEEVHVHKAFEKLIKGSMGKKGYDTTGLNQTVQLE